MRSHVVATAAVGALSWFGPEQALACGATPERTLPLLPLEGAAALPLDTALISSSNFGATRFFLQRVGADAGAATEVADVTCYRGLGGAVCVAKPELAPNSEYRWSVVLAEDSPEAADVPQDGEGWRTFATALAATGDATEPELSVSVETNDVFESPNCGIGSYVELLVAGKYDAVSSSPAVVNVAGFAPTYLTDARVISPSEQATLRLWDPPNCIELEMYSASGARTVLSMDPLCIDDERAPSLLRMDGSRVPLDAEVEEDAGADDILAPPVARGVNTSKSEADCAMAPGGPGKSSSGLLVASLAALAALSFAVRRRARTTNTPG